MSKLIMALNIVSLHKKFILRAAQLGVRNISLCKALRKSHYETLGLTREATQADIKNAYFELSKLYHPDRIAATDENLAKFREVSAAYEVLGNEHSRRLYDRGLLGEVGKVDSGEPDTPEDPVVRFYKHRQQMGAYDKKVEEMAAWTQTYLKQIRESKKHQLYKESEVTMQDRAEGNITFEICVVFLLVILYATNFADTRLMEIYRKLTSNVSIW